MKVHLLMVDQETYPDAGYVPIGVYSTIEKANIAKKTAIEYGYSADDLIIEEMQLDHDSSTNTLII